MYQTSYPTQEQIPERVRDLYDEQPDGSWRFAMDVPGETVPEALVGQIEERAEARVAQAEARVRELSGSLEGLRTEAEELRSGLVRDKIAAAVRLAAQAEGVMPSAYEDAEAAALAAGVVLEGDRAITPDGRSVREWLIDRRADRRHWFAPPRAPRPRLFNS